jgi:menaquinone-specific isochorismate synthase
VLREASRLWSIRLPAEGVVPREVVRAHRGPRMYWERPGLALAGVGIAAEFAAWGAGRLESLQTQLSTLLRAATRFGGAQPRVFGGFAFQDDFVPDNTWSVYAPAQFVLPHFQVDEQDDVTWLTVNVLTEADEVLDESTLRAAARARLSELRQARAEPARIPTPVSTRYPLAPEAWARLVTQATAAMTTGALTKVVLARACEVAFAQPVDVADTLEHLGQHYPECYRFLFEPRARHAVFGATPELLARVEGNRLETMALAGSIRRGTTASEDADLADQLWRDPKERHEHALVVEGLRERLAGWADPIAMPAVPEVMRLRNIHHLHTPVTARAGAGGALAAVARLHPTPALGGTPQEAALAFIRAHEPMPRGWYAAPVGWVDADLDGEFAVAIRSAVAEERRVWLYAGAGIVAGSEPEREWRETALKFRPMLTALGVPELLNEPLG